MPLNHLLAFALLLTASCHRSSSSANDPTPPSTITAQVAGTTPTNFAVNVEPDESVFVEFSEPVANAPEGAIEVATGGQPLAGTLTRIESGTVWRWTPTRELPRGSLLEVRVTTTAGTQIPTTFTVRESIEQSTILIPGVQTTGVMTWPNGRRLVLAGIRSFEIVNGTAVERFLQVPPIASFATHRTFGNGRYVFTKFDGLMGTVVRGNLDGTSESIPMPTDSFRISINKRGDLVTLVAGPNAPVNQRGIWLLRTSESIWQLVGPLPDITEGTPCIDGDGNVMIARIVNDAPELVRFRNGSTQPEVYAATTINPARRASFGVGEDGNGTLVWREDLLLRAATFTPGEALVPLATSTAMFEPFTAQLLSVLTARDGATLAVTTRFGSMGEINNALVRITSQGLPANPQDLGATAIAPLPSPERGEWIALRQDGSRLFATANRPGAYVDPFQPIYEHSLGSDTFFAHAIAIDDSGRMTLAVNETPGLLRVVLFD